MSRLTEQPYFRGSDFALIVALFAIWPLAWTLRERAWPAMARNLGRLALYGSNRENHLRIIRDTLDCSEEVAREIDLENATNVLLRQFHVLRFYRPGNWSPNFIIEGANHIDDGVANGAGVVLWTAPFRFSDLMSKMGLHREGYRFTQLSMPGHGWSTTIFGMRWLNPVWTRMENEFVLKRVVIDVCDPKYAVAEMRDVLLKNGIASISAVKGAARRPFTVRILNGSYKLGLGAPILAHQTGAALLPVFTIRQPNGSFRIVIESAIQVESNLSQFDAAAQAAEAFARLLDRHLVSAPGQWYWGGMLPSKEQDVIPNLL